MLILFVLLFTLPLFPLLYKLVLLFVPNTFYDFTLYRTLSLLFTDLDRDLFLILLPDSTTIDYELYIHHIKNTSAMTYPSPNTTISHSSLSPPLLPHISTQHQQNSTLIVGNFDTACFDCLWSSPSQYPPDRLVSPGLDGTLILNLFSLNYLFSNTLSISYHIPIMSLSVSIH